MKGIQVVPPFLFAIYFVAGIYSQNASQVPLHWMLRPLIVSVPPSIAIYFLLYRKYRDPAYAGWVTTLSLIWLFSGHIYRLLLERSIFWRTPVGGLIAVVLITLPVGLLASRWLWRKITSQQAITTLLNVMGFVLDPIRKISRGCHSERLKGAKNL